MSASFIANALSTAHDPRRVPSQPTIVGVAENQVEVRTAGNIQGMSKQLQYAYQKDLAERFGLEAVPLGESYIFLKQSWGICDRERIYRLTGKRGPSGDKEVACRICGNRQEWDRYPSLELPKVYPVCGFEGDFATRVFVAYAREDKALADIIIKELEQAQFRIKRSGITRTIGGRLDLKRLNIEMELCKVCVCIWSNRSPGDRDLVSEIGMARDMALPILFAKVETADPQPRPDTERVLDLNGPALWDAVLSIH